MTNTPPEQARAALEAVELARSRVAAEVGLPRGYWWAMAAGWVGLGVLGNVAPWLGGTAATAFGAAHAMVASRLLAGRRRTDRLRVGAAVAGRRTPWVVVGMLIALVGITIAVALGLQADGTEHASVWAAVLVAAVIGFGGPDILRVLRRWARA